jgi:hypothetical protein
MLQSLRHSDTLPKSQASAGADANASGETKTGARSHGAQPLQSPGPVSTTPKPEGGGRLLAMAFRSIPDPAHCQTATVTTFLESVSNPLTIPKLIDKFKKFVYKQWSQFAADFRRMICEAKTYLYPPGSQQSLDAIALSIAFDEQELKIPASKPKTPRK